MESFGNIIRRAREQQGLTQKELAERCGGISPVYISRIERGERVPRLKLCRLLAKALGLDETELLDTAHRDHVPREIRAFLEERSALPISDPLMALVKVADKLEDGKKKQLIKAWHETLKLLDV